jgi:hypothetical protein
MRHNPILRLFTLVRKIQCQRPSGNDAIGGCRADDPPRFDDSWKVAPLAYDTSVPEFPSSLRSDVMVRMQEPAISRDMRPTSRPAALGGRFPIIPPDPSTNREPRWPVATGTSRKAARRLRAVDRAIAEMTRDRRPR